MHRVTETQRWVNTSSFRKAPPVLPHPATRRRGITPIGATISRPTAFGRPAERPCVASESRNGSVRPSSSASLVRNGAYGNEHARHEGACVGASPSRPQAGRAVAFHALRARGSENRDHGRFGGRGVLRGGPYQSRGAKLVRSARDPPGDGLEMQTLHHLRIEFPRFL